MIYSFNCLRNRLLNPRISMFRSLSLDLKFVQNTRPRPSSEGFPESKSRPDDAGYFERILPRHSSPQKKRSKTYCTITSSNSFPKLWLQFEKPDGEGVLCATNISQVRYISNPREHAITVVVGSKYSALVSVQ